MLDRVAGDIVIYCADKDCLCRTHNGKYQEHAQHRQPDTHISINQGTHQEEQPSHQQEAKELDDAKAELGGM